ncbi:alpha,alpha-trehalose-phosphate synthase (UDP-forming) [Lichenicoccus sp.]|uniref:alpha,alpha-trehalose-phosphate synthase (UDP-forming) n=1 Tax=Lichenicoccus sp. TaxID=2781899 RepID=UPI003D1412BA
MGRLVVVSNRVPSPRERSHPAGGLTVGLKDAIRGQPSLWFGWSGQIAGRASGDPTPKRSSQAGVSYATIDLTAAQHRGFYQGFSNRILWPLFHYRMGLVEYSRDDLDTYLEVNELFARCLVPLLQPDDVIWVQDYHLIPLGAALRKLGVTQRIGFFLHTPFPPLALFGALPGAAHLIQAMAAYELVGMQTEEDRAHLQQSLDANDVKAAVIACAIGIDPVEFRSQAVAASNGPEVVRLRESMADRALILGVDRLDYSKGLPQRLMGFERLLKRFPEHRQRVTFLQVAPVSRGDVAEYRALRRRLDELAGRINGEWAEFDWMPIRYITRAIPRDTIAGFLRFARIALVTPLRDGMNLVAKEYVAAQDSADPGVLVLSQFAGAGPEFPEAIQVNPHDPDEIAEGLHQALSMPEAERRTRWHALDAAVHKVTAASWARDFLAALEREPLHGA